jgi:hypothetical protein
MTRNEAKIIDKIFLVFFSFRDINVKVKKRMAKIATASQCQKVK